MTNSATRLRWLPLLPCLGFAVTLLMKIPCSDIWWHLRTGRWIADNSSIPTVDLFSHTAGGPLRYTEAAAQVLYHLIHKVGGESALILFHAACCLLLAWLVVKLARSSAGATALAVGLWAASVHTAMAIKPQMYSYLGFALLLHLITTSGGERHRRIWWIPIVMLCWGNFHRGGSLGLMVIAAAAASMLWQRRRDEAIAMLAVLAASTVALLLNPGGTFYLTSALDLGTRSSFRTLLMDWQPLSGDMLIGKHPTLILLAAGWLAERIWRRRRIDFELLVVAATALLAIRSVRFVPFVAMALVPGTARLIDAWMQGQCAPMVRRLRPSFVHLLLAVVALTIVLGQYLQRVPAPYRGLGAVEFQTPVKLAAFLREHPPPGNMWNRFNHGGYLLYALAPEQKVFIDGRNDTVYEEQFFREALRAPFDANLFARQVRTYGIGHVVTSWSGKSDPSLKFVHGDPEWVLVYWDDVGAVYVRRTPAAAEYLREHGYEQLRPGSAYQRVASLGASAEDDRLADELLRHVDRTPDSIHALLLAAEVSRNRGATRDYQAFVQRAQQLAAERGRSLSSR